MADTTAIDPVVLVGLLLGVLSLVGRTIERMVMRRVPHPVAARRGRRTRGRVTRNKRLAWRGRGRCRRGGCGLGHLRLLSCGGRFYPAHLSNSIMKGFRPAEPDKHGDQKKLAEQAHNDNCLGPSVADLRTDYNSKLRLRRRPQDHKTTGTT